MQDKEIIALIGIGSTFLVSCATLGHSLWSDKRNVFVNTVTTSRLKWIDSLRDEIAEFIAVTKRIKSSIDTQSRQSIDELTMQRDTLLHQIILHLNPRDDEDKEIKRQAERVSTLTDSDTPSQVLSQELVILRDAAAAYLKKEWNRVKKESGENQAKATLAKSRTSDS